MNDVVIWHNPRCSKSRETLALLESHGIAPKIINYLTSPPSRADIQTALAALAIRPVEMMRTKDALFKSLALVPTAPDKDLIEAMVAHPALIERPIVFRGSKAAVGRPPISVLDIL